MDKLRISHQLVQFINNKSDHTFLSFDIVEFYPSITEERLDDVITWAKLLIKIPEDEITVNKHPRKSLLFYNKKTWVKNNDQSLFDVTMRSYDGPEVCGLVGLFLLNNKLTDIDLVKIASGCIGTTACYFLKVRGLN